MTDPRVEHQTRRNELVDVALTVLERDGFASLSVGAVARQAGIKPPSLYKQFTSKADIEAALITLGFARLADEYIGPAASAAEGSRLDHITALVSAYRAFGLANPQLYLLMHSKPFTGTDSERIDRAAVSRLRAFVAGPVGAMSAWAYAHGVLSLELVGAFPPELLDDIWARVSQTIAEFAPDE
ncbi:TetR/AcrR family transcriptional regulator [Salinibacterium hongtaonis]|uniref:TetR/AcrR family transcriptional regulator n=1 Tax=Homoserinimonas hongtaonis TaxID=2079791 RepID=UPI000D36BB09|nr:TetR/AcrR family transcriptional regulator [Salinibacterium hongtaonis]AWB89899.1 TetR family transcriptional regulator [Salinibacterium hongtaonis]